MRVPRFRSAAWAGLLLGFLLTLFLLLFVAVAVMFLSWGKSTLAGLPQMPEWTLPSLVRAAPAARPDGGQAGLSWQAPGIAPVSQNLAATKRVTVLVMGVDSRPDERVETTRTDTIMVLTVNPETGAAGLLSIPRDLLVYVPALKHDAKINTLHALGYANRYPGGGPAMLKDTVADLIGYPIDYYVRVNFDGFRQLVDLLGGVDLDVPAAIDDPEYPDKAYGYDPLHIPAGHQHMDGALALKYVRTRHADSDYGRAARQQLVVLAMKDRLTQPGKLASLLPRAPALALALSGSVQTDMPVDQAIALARLLDQADLKNPVRVVIDNTDGVEVPDDPTYGFILKVQPAAIHLAAATIFADKPSVTSPEATLAAALKKEQARVVVLNGGAGQAAAAQVTAALSSQGYNVVATGDAAPDDVGPTKLITYGDGGVIAREALIRQFNLSPDRIRSEPPSAEADLALVLGSNEAESGQGNP
ncbi:MAG TPA: LCP family protein [Anaerolineae bacterium]